MYGFLFTRCKTVQVSYQSFRLMYLYVKFRSVSLQVFSEYPATRTSQSSCLFLHVINLIDHTAFTLSTFGKLSVLPHAHVVLCGPKDGCNLKQPQFSVKSAFNISFSPILCIEKFYLKLTLLKVLALTLGDTLEKRTLRGHTLRNVGR